ncbi:alpha/beta hydrolase [Nonomuraea sp. JJY05]|uniref:alpha/beta hydrolase n=1 Tax=Nonomuraea sp. JJY05 TaxID=3350255 RepID=UPI00373FAA6C
MTSLVLAVLLGVTGVVPLSHETTTIQDLVWGPCPEDQQELAEAHGQCAKVTVPLDYAAPTGRTIQIAISRIRATDPGRRKGVLLANPGGPGGPGLGFAAHLRATLKQVAGQYDLIGFDPRFVGESTPISCGSGQVWQRSPGFDRAGFDAMTDDMRAIARRCASQKGNAGLLPYASTRNVARDMDLIRSALGETTLSYYGVSYGADLGAVYTQLFPHRAGRIILDSSTDPGATQYELFQRTGPRSETALDTWATWTAKRSSTYRLGDTRAKVRATVTKLLAAGEREPIKIGQGTVDGHRLPLILSRFLQQQDDNAALAASVRELSDAAAGEQVEPGPALTAILRLLVAKGPEVDRWMAGQLAVLCGDGGWPAGGWPRDPERYWHDIRASRATQPVFGALANSITPCAFWPFPPREAGTPIHNRVPVLMLQGRHDINTVYEGAVALHRKLTGSRLITVDLRAHGVYIRRSDGHKPSVCAERLVNTYLTDGSLPTQDIDCAQGNKD